MKSLLRHTVSTAKPLLLCFACIFALLEGCANTEKMRQDEEVDKALSRLRERIENSSAVSDFQGEINSSESEKPRFDKRVLAPLDDSKFEAYSKVDLYIYLGGHGLSFEKKVLYRGTHLEVIQKVAGGYLITGDSSIYSGQMGVAFLGTNARLQEHGTYCMWVFYTGTYDYVSLNGFRQSVPRLSVYKGTAPVQNGDPCNESWPGKK